MPTAVQLRKLHNIGREPTAEETNQHAMMRARTEEYLSKEPKRYMRESWLNQFDQSPMIMKRAVYDSVIARYGN